MKAGRILINRWVSSAFTLALTRPLYFGQDRPSPLAISARVSREERPRFLGRTLPRVNYIVIGGCLYPEATPRRQQPRELFAFDGSESFSDLLSRYL